MASTVKTTKLSDADFVAMRRKDGIPEGRIVNELLARQALPTGEVLETYATEVALSNVRIAGQRVGEPYNKGHYLGFALKDGAITDKSVLSVRAGAGSTFKAGIYTLTLVWNREGQAPPNKKPSKHSPKA